MKKEKLVDEVFTLIGNRLLHLHRFVVLVAEDESVKSLESVRAAAHAFALKQEVLSKLALDKFTTYCFSREQGQAA